MKFKSTTLNPRALVYRRFIEIVSSYNQNVVYQTTDNKYWLFDQNEEKFIETESRENVTAVGNLDMLKFYNSYFRYVNGWLKFGENEIPKTESQNISEKYDLTTHTFEYGVGFNGLESKLANFSVKIYYETENVTTTNVYGYIAQDNKKYEFPITGISSGREYTLTATGEWTDVVSGSTAIVIYFENVALEGVSIQVSYTLQAQNLLSAKFNNIAKYQFNKYYYVGSMDYMVKGSIEGTTTQYIKGNIIPLTSLNIKYFNDDIKLNPDDLIVIDKHLYSIENVEDVVKRQPKKFAVHFATLNSIL